MLPMRFDSRPIFMHLRSYINFLSENVSSLKALIKDGIK